MILTQTLSQHTSSLQNRSSLIMWSLLLLIGLHTQVSRAGPCEVVGVMVRCSFQNLTVVPSLPSYIQTLYLDYNWISEVNSSTLRGLDQLRVIDLGAQYVPLVIRNNAFLSQRRLQTLNLGYSPGLRLEPRAFSGLYSLQTLLLFYCDLTGSILSDNYLQPLWSLETLDLSFNHIETLRPGGFFSRMTQFKDLNLKLNHIDRLCEEDLIGFQGRVFTQFNLNSNKLGRFDWAQCGNPFTNMSINTLDISSNGFNMSTLKRFFKAIDGTPIALLHSSDGLGRDFSFNNLPDPDKETFEGLRNSSVQVFDLAKNCIFALSEAVFSPLTDAIIINVSINKINQILPDAFSGLQNSLLMLNLSSNLLGEVRRETFDHLTVLRVLDLSYNHIGALGYEAFRGLPSLKYLDLRGNSLRRLGSTGFLPNLLSLALSDNRLESLWGIGDLAGDNIAYLELQDNRLTFLDDFLTIVEHYKYLETLFFGGNFIKWCRSPHVEAVNNSLSVLDLHDSSLQVIWTQGRCLDMFDHLNGILGLNLTHNSLTALPLGIFRGLSSVIEMDLSSNALTYLQPNTFPNSLLRLHLSNNFLASPDPDTFTSLMFIDLADNHFYCDCNLENFLWWINSTNVTFLSPMEELRCEFPSQIQGLPLLNYSSIAEPCDTDDDEAAIPAIRLALFISSTLLVITAMLGGIVYARLRGRIFIIYKKVIGRVLEGPKPPPPQENMQYDAFVCYSNADYKWVEKALLKKLDSGFSDKNLFRCCFEARDFLPGEDHLGNIRDAIWSSRKTVCVVSREFLKDGWCLEAFTLAQGRKLEELSNVLIVVVVGKVQHYQLMKHQAVRAFVQTREYLVWPEDPQDLAWFYQRLIIHILKDNTPNNKKQEEEGQQQNNAVPLENVPPQPV